MASARETLAIIINGDGSGAISEFRRVGASAKKELGDAETLAKKFGGATSAALIAGGAAVAAAGGGILLSMKKLSDSYVQVGRDTAKLQRLTGGTAEDMSRLRFAAQMSGIGVDQLSIGLVRLSKGAMADGGKALKEYGVSLNDVNGNTRPTLAVLKDIATQFEAMPNGAEKTAAAVKLFGRSGADLIPLLNRGAAGIQELAAESDRLGLTLNEKDLVGIKEYVKNQRELSASWQALQVQLGKSAFPVISEGMKKAAGVASGLASTFNKLSPEIRTTAGTAVGLGAGFATLAGTTAVAIGTGARIVNTFRDQEGQLSKTGVALKGFGMLLAGLAISEAVFSAINAGTNALGNFENGINATVAASNRGGPAIGAAFAEAAAQQDAVLELQNVWTDFGARVILTADGAKGSIEDVQQTFDRLGQVDPKSAGLVLDQLQLVTNGLDRNSDQYRTNQEFIDRNRKALVDKAAADAELAGQQDTTAGALDTVTYSLDRQTFAMQYNAQTSQQSKGIYQTYVDTVSGSVNTFLALIDANRNYADAQKRMAEIGSGSTKEVIDATKRLTDAQQRLNDVLNDDPMMGMQSVSAESQIADARNRLADANARLAANPNDALGLTMKDEAIGDLERATKRRQDEARNKQQRDRQIRDAEQQVTDAQAALAEAQSKTGINSEEYQRAAEDVIKANMMVEAADAALAQWLQDHGITAVSEMNGVLDAWIAKGGPLGEAAQRMKDQIQPLVDQANGWAFALGIVDQKQKDVVASTPAPPAGGKPRESFKPNWWESGTGFLGGVIGPIIDGFGSIEMPRFRMATGGLIPGNGNTDSVPAMLMPGEFVLRKSAVAELGIGNLARLNGGADFDARNLGRMTSPTWAPRPVTNRNDSVTINATIVQHTAAPDTSGAAVVSALRGIAHRSGRGLKVA